MIIGNVSWVKFIHEHWYNKPWGQSKRYLPRPMREIADKLFPDYDDNLLLTFGMMREIVIALEERLQHLGVERLQIEVDYFRERDDGSLVAIQGEKEYTVAETPRFEIFNAAVTPNMPKDFKANHCGYMYRSVREDFCPNTIIPGSGANLTWAARDVSSLRNLVHLQMPGDRPREDLYDKIYCSMRMEDCHIDTSEDGIVTLEGFDNISKTQKIITASVDEVYSAMGYRFNQEIVADIDPNKVQNIDTTPKSEGISVGSYMNRTTSIRPTDFRGTAVPPGNLSSNFFQVQKALGHYSHTSANSIIVFDHFKESVIESAVAHGIYFADDSIFEWLKPKVQEAYRSGVPSEEVIYKLIRAAYQSPETSSAFACYNETETHELTVDEFMQIVKPVVDEVVHEFDEKNFSESFDDDENISDTNTPSMK